MRRSRCLLLVVGAALATGGAGALLTTARAADAPQGAAPAMQPKIVHPFLLALVGAWDVTATGPMGESRARSTFALGLGDTVLLHDWSGDAFGAPFFGHGLYKVSDDGKTVVCWWFDAYTAGPLKMIGPLTETTAELSGSGALGAVTITWKAVDGGIDWTMSTNGAPTMKQAYRRPPK